jgi:serine/threonine protein kinase
MDSQTQKKIQDFVPAGKDFGSGANGRVKRMKEINSQQIFAVKEIPKTQGNQSEEITIHLGQKHKHIVELHWCLTGKGFYHLVLSAYENGNLFDYLYKSKKVLTEMDIFKFFIQTCFAVNYLHKKQVMHRDIKPENLLFDEDYNIKLCDFGCAKSKLTSEK